MAQFLEEKITLHLGLGDITDPDILQVHLAQLGIPYNPMPPLPADADQAKKCLAQYLGYLRQLFNAGTDAQLAAIFAQNPTTDIISRRDPFGLHTTLCSGIRDKKQAPPAKAPENAKPPLSCDQKCDFTVKDYPLLKRPQYAKTRFARTGWDIPSVVMHPDARETFSVLNPRPYNTPLYMTALSQNHTDATKDLAVAVSEEVLKAFLITGRDFCRMFRAAGYLGMHDFMNFGTKAGASEKHAHAQRSRLYATHAPLADQEIAMSRDDPDMSAYLRELLEPEKALQVHAYHSAVVAAPFAPRFDRQMDVYMNDHLGVPVRHLDEMTDSDITDVSNALFNIVRGLQANGISNFNITTHQPRFQDARGRLHWHVCPRERAIAGMEIQHMHVVGTLPEDAAADMKKYFPGGCYGQ